MKLAATLLTLFTACAASPDEVAPPAADTPLIATPATPVTVAGDWRARIAAELTALRADAPTLYAELSRLAPQVTRARTLRFTTAVIHEPRAAAVFLDRLASAGDSPEVRAALIEALPRTGGAYADAVAELFAAELDAGVRGVYLHAVRRAPAALAMPVIQRGLVDAAVEVQAEAARTAAAHPDGVRLAAELRAALATADGTVRAEAARALGILGVAAARDELAAHLADPTAEVRLEALRAIDRIQPGSLVGKSVLTTLVTDPDPRVARLATRLSAPVDRVR